MEQQAVSVCLRVCRSRACHLGSLSGGEADDSALLEVIIAAAIFDVAGFLHFQVDGIKSVSYPEVVNCPCGFVQVGDADEWVQRCQSVKVVVAVDLV